MTGGGKMGGFGRVDTRKKAQCGAGWGSLRGNIRSE